MLNNADFLIFPGFPLVAENRHDNGHGRGRGRGRWKLMEGLHARLVGKGRAVVGGTTNQVCSVLYLLLNFEGTDQSVHERLAETATADGEVDEDFVVDVVLMVGAAYIVLSFLA